MINKQGLIGITIIILAIPLYTFSLWFSVTLILLGIGVIAMRNEK